MIKRSDMSLIKHLQTLFNSIIESDYYSNFGTRGYFAQYINQIKKIIETTTDV